MIPLTQGNPPQPLYYLRRISDKFVQITRALSNTIPPNPPNPGPDQEYIPIMIEDPAPDFDPTYSVRTKTEAVNETAHQVEIKYKVEDRPLDDRVTAVKNARRLQTSKQFPPQDSSDALVLTCAAILRAAKGLVLTPIEQAYADKLIATAAALQKNADNETALLAAVADGQKPDLSAGWEPVAAAVVATP